MDVKKPQEAYVPKADAGGKGKEVKKDIGAPKEIEPSSPGLVLALIEEGFDTQKAQGSQGDHDEIVGAPFLSKGVKQKEA